MASTQAQTQAGSFVRRATQVASWPPLVYFLLGLVCLGFWGAGTSVQVQTSEAWIMGEHVTSIPTLATFLQIWKFFSGTLPATFVVPFTFAWGVQLALIIASVGIELPKYPKWRYYLSWGVVLLLIGVNSAGDYQYSGPYGFWGQAGFTLVILFVTFCLGLLAVMCFIHGFQKLTHAGN